MKTKEEIQQRIDNEQKTLDTSKSLTLDHDLVKAQETINILKWVLKDGKQG